jgi:hypothetical protein
MADVEMKDAAPSDSKTTVAKSSKSGVVDGGDNKKRFEVKKVRAATFLRGLGLEG